jgi:8-amino-7-oxononanoate synthase
VNPYEAILDHLRSKSLFRALHTLEAVDGCVVRIGDETCVNFASNDYLALSQHPALRAAAKEAIDQYGVGAGASRLVTGSMAPHQKLEAALAAFKRAQAALVFGSGYAAALGTVSSLVGPRDVIILDKLVHACLIDGAKLSGAQLRIFAHNDIGRLEDLLRWARAKHPDGGVLILTESVFSMDGDLGNLAEIVQLKNKYGALLLVDEAHATGVLGKGGAGLAADLGLADQIDIQMGTLSKAFGVSGGFIVGSRPLIDLLINRARSFIFSTAPPPALAAAACAALDLIQSEEGDRLRATLFSNIAALSQQLPARLPQKPVSAILPVIVGDERSALELASRLRESGFLVPAIRYPTVARGAARLRITLSAGHSSDHVRGLAAALARQL